jgi:hypothetical protein
MAEIHAVVPGEAESAWLEKMSRVSEECMSWIIAEREAGAS